MRFDMHIKEREAAQVYPNGCRVYRKTITKTDGTQKYAAMFFNPKSVRPVWHYTFKTVPLRREYIENALAAYDRGQATKIAYRKARTTGDPSQMDPGTILSYSWGYDQTNVEHFQVISRSGLTVKIAKISAERVGDSRVRAVPGSFAMCCKVCGKSERSLRHDKDEPRDANMLQYDHDYVPTIATQTKRIQFASWRNDGLPPVAFLSMNHGNANIVNVLKFGNADPLVTGSEYETPFGFGH